MGKRFDDGASMLRLAALGLLIGFAMACRAIGRHSRGYGAAFGAWFPLLVALWSAWSTVAAASVISHADHAMLENCPTLWAKSASSKEQS